MPHASLTKLSPTELTKLGGLKSHCSENIHCVAHGHLFPCALCDLEGTGTLGTVCVTCGFKFASPPPTGQKYCRSVDQFLKNGIIAFEAEALKRAAVAKPKPAVVAPPTASPAPAAPRAAARRPVPPAALDHNPGCLLSLGIFLIPYIFVWFLLRRGYSQLSRVLGFGWLALLLWVIVFSSEDPVTHHRADLAATGCKQDKEIQFRELIWSWNDRDYIIGPGYTRQARAEPRTCFPATRELPQGTNIRILREAANHSTGEPNTSWFEFSLADGSLWYAPKSELNGALFNPGDYLAALEKWNQAIAAQVNAGTYGAEDPASQTWPPVVQPKYTDEESYEDNSGAEYPALDRTGSIDPTSQTMNPPRYPPEELRRRIQGTTTLIVNLDAYGDVIDVSVERSSGNRNLDREAVKAARRWLFNPGIENGRPVASRVRVPVAYAISDER